MSKHPLRVYKNMLLIAKRLPDAAKREGALAEIRNAFRANAGASCQEEIAELLKGAEAKISYLKIVTPRPKGLRAGGNKGDGSVLSADSGSQTFAYGESTTGTQNGTKVPLASRDYTEAVGRHIKSVRRQHFMDRGVPPPRSPMQ